MNSKNSFKNHKSGQQRARVNDGAFVGANVKRQNPLAFHTSPFEFQWCARSTHCMQHGCDYTVHRATVLAPSVLFDKHCAFSSACQATSHQSPTFQHLEPKFWTLKSSAILELSHAAILDEADLRPRRNVPYRNPSVVDDFQKCF